MEAEILPYQNWAAAVAAAGVFEVLPENVLRKMGEVFSNDMLVENILEKIIMENDRTTVRQCRLVSKQWLCLTAKLYRKKKKPQFLVNTNKDGSLNEPRVRPFFEQHTLLYEFIRPMTRTDRIEGFVPPFALRLGPSYFRKSNYSDFVNCIMQCGSSLVELYIKFPKNSAMSFLLPPGMSLPNLNFLGVSFSGQSLLGHHYPVPYHHQHDYFPNHCTIHLVQSILNAANNLKTLQFMTCTNPVNPPDLENLYLPDCLGSILVDTPLRDFELLLRKNFQCLSHIRLSATIALYSEESIYELFSKLSGTLRNITLTGAPGTRRSLPIKLPRMPFLSKFVIFKPWEFEERTPPVNFEDVFPNLKELVFANQTEYSFSYMMSSMKLTSVTSFHVWLTSIRAPNPILNLARRPEEVRNVAGGIVAQNINMRLPQELIQRREQRIRHLQQRLQAIRDMGARRYMLRGDAGDPVAGAAAAVAQGQGQPAQGGAQRQDQQQQPELQLVQQHWLQHRPPPPPAHADADRMLPPGLRAADGQDMDFFEERLRDHIEHLLDHQREPQYFDHFFREPPRILPPVAHAGNRPPALIARQAGVVRVRVNLGPGELVPFPEGPVGIGRIMIHPLHMPHPFAPYPAVEAVHQANARLPQDDNAPPLPVRNAPAGENERRLDEMRRAVEDLAAVVNELPRRQMQVNPPPEEVVLPDGEVNPHANVAVVQPNNFQPEIVPEVAAGENNGPAPPEEPHEIENAVANANIAAAAAAMMAAPLPPPILQAENGDQAAEIANNEEQNGGGDEEGRDEPINRRARVRAARRYRERIMLQARNRAFQPFLPQANLPDRPVTMNLSKMQSINLAFPNLTSLTITICGPEICGMKYIFEEMTGLKSLRIIVEPSLWTIKWDSLLTGIPSDFCEAVKSSSDLWEELYLHENHVSIKTMKKLEDLTLLECHKADDQSQLAAGESHISDVAFHFALLKMKKLRHLTVSPGFTPSQAMYKKWYEDKGYRIKTQPKRRLDSSYYEP
ncbi:hypothetical protein Ocin01_05237 [Orchesella cincta]|uniref:Uncharacterized protein n=1 Tax=Orchesella cincta TaxID=48709 RepID=A0A1D2N8X0_ORCCI|nr:hypothetical protein Ocin01_05237 [Orchesella cincta]